MGPRRKPWSGALMTELAVVWGLVSGTAFTVVVLLSWRITPEVWIGDVTDGEQSPETNVVNVVWFVLVTLTFVGGGFVAAWFAAARFDASLLEAALVAYGAMAIVNLVDLVVVDIVIYLWMRPAWMVLPGLEMPTDYGMHVRGAVKGFAMAVPIALVAGAVSLFA